MYWKGLTMWSVNDGLSGGFQRFPDNPSLTDHTVAISKLDLPNSVLTSEDEKKKVTINP